MTQTMRWLIEYIDVWVDVIKWIWERSVEGRYDASTELSGTMGRSG